MHRLRRSKIADGVKRRPPVAAAGVPLDELRMWIEAGHSHMVMRTRMSPDAVDAKLTERFSDQVQARIEDAKSVLARLTARAGG